MPWASRVNSILEAWYGGSRGAEAVANILFGDVNPSAKLPVTFPLRDTDLPHPVLVKPPVASTTRDGDPDAWKKIAAGLPAFQIAYDEGLKVGYKWYDAEKKPVLFPFGYGLSYTSFAYSDLRVETDHGVRVSFTVRNVGQRDGAEVAQVYASLPAAAEEPPKRLVGWAKVNLKAGENQTVTIPIENLHLSIFNETRSGWQIVPGSYTFLVGGSSRDLPLKQTVELK